MSRQCLYCAKELPKSSASNFCSKECWTEYKKLKALNVGADRQATVMLKRSELQEQEQNKPPTPMRNEPGPSATKTKPVTKSEPAPETQPEVLDESVQEQEVLPAGKAVVDDALLERIERMEEIINAIPPDGSEDTAGISGEQLDQLESRIKVLENSLDEVIARLDNAEAMDNRISFLEKRVKSLSSLEETVNSRGFFARLFN